MSVKISQRTLKAISDRRKTMDDYNQDAILMALAAAGIDEVLVMFEKDNSPYLDLHTTEDEILAKQLMEKLETTMIKIQVLDILDANPYAKKYRFKMTIENAIKFFCRNYLDRNYEKWDAIFDVVFNSTEWRIELNIGRKVIYM